MVIEAGASHSTLKSLNKPPEHKIQLNPSIQGFNQRLNWFSSKRYIFFFTI